MGFRCLSSYVQLQKSVLDPIQQIVLKNVYQIMLKTLAREHLKCKSPVIEEQNILFSCITFQLCCLK